MESAGSILLSFFKEHFWVAKVVFVLLGVIILHLALKLFVSIVKSKSIIKKFSWKEKIDYILLKPAHCLIWTFGIFFCVKIVGDRFNLDVVLKYIYPIREAFLIFIVTWFLLRWKNSFQLFLHSKKNKKHIDSATIDFIGKLVSIVIVFIFLLIVLPILGVDIVPLVAFGGVGAAAIGFAAKDVIANFFGGFMVYITRPFKVGDLIEIPKETIVGTIEHIGWYLTCIRNLDKCPIYVPNAVFSTSQILNSTRRSHRKIEARIGVRYQDFSKLNSILEDVKDLIKKDETVDDTQANIINFSSFNDYSLEIYIRIYVRSCSLADYFSQKQKMLMKINGIILSKGADIAFPTNTVHLEK